MTETHYAHGVTAEGLRIFLDFWPSFSAGGEDVRQMLISDKDLFFGKDSIPFSWCYREQHFGIKPDRSWQEAVVRFLEVKSHLRDVKQYRGQCRRLHVYLGGMMLNQISGDTVWHIVQRESKRGVKIATINRHLAVMRAILRMARDEWQWVDVIPKVKLLPGEVVCCLRHL